MIISIFSGLMFAVNSSLYIVWLRRTRPFRDLEAELWMATSKKSYIQCWIVAVNWCCQQLCFGTCYTPAFRRQLYCEDSAPRTLTSLDKHPAQTCDSFVVEVVLNRLKLCVLQSALLKTAGLSSSDVFWHHLQTPESRHVHPHQIPILENSGGICWYSFRFY